MVFVGRINNTMSFRPTSSCRTDAFVLGIGGDGAGPVVLFGFADYLNRYKN